MLPNRIGPGRRTWLTCLKPLTQRRRTVKDWNAHSSFRQNEHNAVKFETYGQFPEYLAWERRRNLARAKVAGNAGKGDVSTSSGPAPDDLLAIPAFLRREA